MRKNKGLFLVLATLLAVTCLLVSCNSEVSENATGGGDKLVYATFGKGNTKALTGTTISTSYKLEEIGDVYWFYKASKADQGGRSGAQSSWYPVIPGQKGLDGVIGPFSTGLWNFEVIAYKDCSISPATSDASVTVGETTYYMNTAVFAGSVNGVSLATGTQANPDPINVTVTLQTSGSNGTLTLDRDFVFEWAPGGGGTTDLTLKAVYGTGASDYKTVTLTWDSTSSKYVISSESDTQWAFAAGDYEFDFEVYYTLNNVQYTVATASNVALKVYGGQETIIKASILEGNFVYAKINATVKSTAVANTVTTDASTTFITSYTPASIKSGSVSQTEVTSIKFEAGSLAATGTKTQIEDTDTYSRIDSYKTEVSVSDIDAAQAQAANFTVAADATPVAAIDASLFVTTSIVNSNNEVQENSTATEKVTTFDSTVKVLTTYISKNLTDVAVYYNGSSAVQYTQGQTTGDGFDYEPSTGKLTVYTTHFSEFYVSSKSVAYIPETDTAYDTVQAAFGAVESGQTIQLLKDCSITESFRIDDSNIVWDLNGKTVTYWDKNVNVASSIVIKNGDIVARNFTRGKAPIYVRRGANLVINDVNIEAKYTEDNEVKTAYAINGWDSGTQDAPIKLTINGGTFDGVVCTNGQFRYYNVEINGGTFNEGVYFPAYGEYVINGGTFNNSVEIKSGSLTINGGKFNYDTDEYNYVPYENGTAVHGCCVAAVAYNGTVENTATYGPTPTVTVHGGTFAGSIGLARKSYMYSYPSIDIDSSVTATVEYLGEDVKFAGGTGTKEDPFLVYDYATMQKISEYANQGYTYFAVAIDRTNNGHIDCSNWNTVVLNGSFDGMGVTFDNLDAYLFQTIDNQEKIEVKNAVINANINQGDSSGRAAAVLRHAAGETHIENITVHGYITSTYVAAFIGWTRGSQSTTIYFDSCYSDATLAGTTASAALVAHPWVNVPSQIDRYFYVKDTLYEGIMSGTYHSFLYACNAGGAVNKEMYITFTDPSMLSRFRDVCIAILGENTNGNGYDFKWCPNSTDILNQSGNGVNDTTTGVMGLKNYVRTSSIEVISHNGSALTKGELVSIAKHASATTWSARFEVGPNDKNGYGNYTGCYVGPESLTNNNGTLTTKNIYACEVWVNSDITGSTGYTSDHTKFNVVNDIYGTTFGSASITISQFDSEGRLVQIDVWDLKK